MKRFSLVLVCFILFTSCDSNTNDIMDQMIAPGDSGNNSDVPILSEDEILLKGDFVDDAHPTSGKCAINTDGTSLVITNFKSDNGPVLNMYLATDAKSTEYVDLGVLKGLEGNFVYSIPAGTDFKKYNVVVVWCVDFAVSFGHADLK